MEAKCEKTTTLIWAAWLVHLVAWFCGSRRGDISARYTRLASFPCGRMCAVAVPGY